MNTLKLMTVLADGMFKNMKFDPMGFVDLLSYMGAGMLGIFIIIGLIAVATILINKIFSHTGEKDKDGE